MEIPIQAISADKLNIESPIKYDDICRLVGHLYIDSYVRANSMEENFKSIVRQYTEQYEQLSNENAMLKKSLAEKNT